MILHLTKSTTPSIIIAAIKGHNLNIEFLPEILIKLYGVLLLKRLHVAGLQYGNLKMTLIMWHPNLVHLVL
jgi:hypothetical protein